MSDAELLAHDPGLDRAHASTADAAVSALGTDSTRGLTDADAASRLTATGANRFRTPRRVTFRHVLADEITEPMMLLLVAVAVLYSVWGRLEDTIAIVVIISAVVLVEVFAEYRAKTVIAALGKLTAPTAPVLRDGRTEQVPTEDLVPGDVIPLRAGARVPADVRLVGTWGLRVDESALTGESVAVGKDADDVLPDDTALAERTNLAFAGTTVAAGRARGVVVATGMATELGRITGLVLEAKPPRTAMQQAMRDLSRVLAMVAIGFSVLVPLIGIIGGQPWREMVLTGLTMAFATVPEELPIIISLVLGLGAYRLSRRNGLVRRLRAAEALGTVTTIATDKTGTLTENRMAVTSLAADAIPDDHLLALGAACHDATTEGTEFAGDPTDVAFLEAARDRDLLPGSPGGVFGDVVARFAFDAHRESMTVVHTRDDGRFLLITKGAPEALLERCTARGGHRALGADDRAELAARAERMAADGLRVIAVATRVLAVVPASVQDAEEHLTFAGLVGLEDPPRAEVPEAMAAARRAGIRVLMVTGDHPACARAIAAQIGLDGAGPLLTGHELDRLDDAALTEAVSRTSLFARVTPEHKIRLVEALQGRGEIVAVTGDGINDAPALARADVGIAMGASGTDVARDSADLVLADDNFATITRALREGRTLYDNLRKGVKYYLACKAGLVVTTAVGVLVGLPIPFAPIQIVVMEMFMDIAGSATFAAEPAERDAMNRPPRDPRDRFLDRALVRGLIAGGVSLFAAVGGIYLVASWSGESTETAQTLAFLAWMVGYLALAWVMRSERTPLAGIGLLSNRFLPAWTVVTAVSIALIMFVPFLREVLRLVPLSGTQWAVVVLLPIVAVSWIEIAKWVRPRDSATAGTVQYSGV
ncbi:Ca2+-transporting ATPase [Pseudonocardia sediminis]|uniref:Ca2+-transporting ATPase n=1 Tax=Pseudonocardia sediminis TaxID=1397368 RepID=A0A4Q7V878_PSEST|nr:cation-transporting P-type ATPase [Pseudonocardia sediminis]RZT88999.1 Ca2+-transporting ATPase [Pseudonocardia sediminis]